MAPGSRLRRSPRLNLPNPGDNELGGNPSKATIESSCSPVLTSRDSSLEPTPAHAPASAVPSTNDELFKKFMEAYLAAQGQPPAPIPSSTPAPAPAPFEPCERLLKARFPELYFDNSHTDCYNFCQQYEDYFETARATGINRVSFTASFLRGRMPQRWLQHKRRLLALSSDPPTWKQLKGFLQKNFGDSRVFVDNI